MQEAVRANVVIPVAALGLLAVALGLFVRPPGPPGPSVAPVATPESAASEAPIRDVADAAPATAGRARAETRAPLAPATTVSGAATAVPSPDTNSPEAQHQAYVQQRIEELRELGGNQDGESLNAILAELENRDPEIRAAALEATKEFGSRDAIPNLEAAAAQTDSPEEKLRINEAIEWLKLPSLSETVRRR